MQLIRILTMKDNRLRQLEPGYACCVWYAVYQLLSVQLTVVYTKYEYFFNTLLLKTWHRKSVGYFRPAVAALCLIKRYCLLMFAISCCFRCFKWTGYFHIDHCQSKNRVNIDNMRVQPWILCPNLITPLHQIITDPKQVSDPLNYETILFWVGYIMFISTSTADLEYFSVCIHLKNEMLQLFFLVYHYYCSFDFIRDKACRGGEMETSLFWLHCNSQRLTVRLIIREKYVAWVWLLACKCGL